MHIGRCKVMDQRGPNLMIALPPPPIPLISHDLLKQLLYHEHALSDECENYLSARISDRVDNKAKQRE